MVLHFSLAAALKKGKGVRGLAVWVQIRKAVRIRRGPAAVTSPSVCSRSGHATSKTSRGGGRSALLDRHEAGLDVRHTADRKAVDRGLEEVPGYVQAARNCKLTSK